ncbi:hypothetical protein D3C78_1575570 [compost metagenome]
MFVLLASMVEPRAATRIVAVVGVVLTADQRQCLVKKQRLRVHRALRVMFDTPDLIRRRFRGFEQCLDGGAAQRTHHEEIAIGITQI